MQKQLAPTGQLVSIGDKLVFQAPTGDRFAVQDDRAAQLARLLPLVSGGALAEQELAAIRQVHDEVLAIEADRWHQLAMAALGGQQKTIDGLVGVLDKLADQAEPVVVHQVVKYSVHADDFLSRLVWVGGVVVLMALTSLSVNLVARTVSGQYSQPAQAQYLR